MNVLYFHHAGFFGGSGRSLLELLLGFKNHDITPHIICQKGKMAEVFAQNFKHVAAVPGLSQFNNTRYSYYRNKRWLVLCRELLLFPVTIFAVIKAKRQFKCIDLVHINDYTLLPVAISARLFFSCPIIVHCRSVQRFEAESRRARIIARLYKKIGATIIAIDEKVASTVPRMLSCSVVHNSLDTHAVSDTKSNPVEKYNEARPLVLGFVGGIGEVKGIFDLLNALALCKERDLHVRLSVTGNFERKKQKGFMGFLLKTVKGTSDVEADVKHLIDALGIGSMVVFNGFNKDLKTVYTAMDVLCFVTHANAPGRPVFEAGFFGRPSIVAIDQSWNDTIIDHQTGLIVKEKNVESIYAAIKYFYDNPDAMYTMGINARELACKNFSIDANTRRVVEIYKSILK